MQKGTIQVFVHLQVLWGLKESWTHERVIRQNSDTTVAEMWCNCATKLHCCSFVREHMLKSNMCLSVDDHAYLFCCSGAQSVPVGCSTGWEVLWLWHPGSDVWADRQPEPPAALHGQVCRPGTQLHKHLVNKNARKIIWWSFRLFLIQVQRLTTECFAVQIIQALWGPFCILTLNKSNYSVLLIKYAFFFIGAVKSRKKMWDKVEGRHAAKGFRSKLNPGHCI